MTAKCHQSTLEKFSLVVAIVVTELDREQYIVIALQNHSSIHDQIWPRWLDFDVTESLSLALVSNSTGCITTSMCPAESRHRSSIHLHILIHLHTFIQNSVIVSSTNLATMKSPAKILSLLLAGTATQAVQAASANVSCPNNSVLVCCTSGLSAGLGIVGGVAIPGCKAATYPNTATTNQGTCVTGLYAICCARELMSLFTNLQTAHNANESFSATYVRHDYKHDGEIRVHSWKPADRGSVQVIANSSALLLVAIEQGKMDLRAKGGGARNAGLGLGR